MPSWGDDRDELVYLEREEDRDEPATWISILAIFAMLGVIVVIVLLGLM